MTNAVRELPRSTLAGDGETLACPWCRGDCGEARVTLEALHQAHVEDQLKVATIRLDGRPGDFVLEATCPHCCRPSAVALQHRHGSPVLRLLPVRTEADVRYEARPFPNPNPDREA